METPNAAYYGELTPTPWGEARARTTDTPDGPSTWSTFPDPSGRFPTIREDTPDGPAFWYADGARAVVVYAPGNGGYLRHPDGIGPVDRTELGALAPAAFWRISSRFGPRISPITGRPSFHGGVDWAMPSGTPILAVETGQVVHAAPSSGAGGPNLLVLRGADGREWTYCHLSRLRASAGQVVAAGAWIADSGTAGTGPHLHLVLKVAGEPRDPLKDVLAFLAPES